MIKCLLGKRRGMGVVSRITILSGNEETFIQLDHFKIKVYRTVGNCKTLN